MPADEVALRLYDYTYDTLATMRDHGVVPEWVQIGNEIRAGILWPLGRYWDAANGGSWDNYAMFLRAGSQAVRDIDPAIKIVMHHDQSGNLGATSWFYGQLENSAIPYDVIGLSYYARWHGTLDAVTNSMLQLGAQFNKPIIIVETAHPWTTTQSFDEAGNILSLRPNFPYPASVDGQIGYLDDLVLRIKSVPNGLGQGLIYWEPEWTPLPGLLPLETTTALGGAGWAIGHGGAWANATLFNQHGMVFDSMSALGNLPPVVDAGAPATIVKGAKFSSGGSFTDEGVNTWTATIDYGDSSGVQPLPLNEDKTFALEHTYSEIGAHDVTVAITDDEGRTGTAATTVTVIYDFSGFAAPIRNPPARTNRQAGSAVAVKFSLAGDQGFTVLASGFPQSQAISCATGAPTGAPSPTTSAGGSGLSFDPATDQYTYMWKTDAAWANTCRQLIVRLADGTEHVATFQFK